MRIRWVVESQSLNVYQQEHLLRIYSPSHGATGNGASPSPSLSRSGGLGLIDGGFPGVADGGGIVGKRMISSPVHKRTTKSSGKRGRGWVRLDAKLSLCTQQPIMFLELFMHLNLIKKHV